MSFAMDLKNELANIKESKCCEKVMLGAILQVSGIISINSLGVSIEVRSKNLNVAKKVEKLVKTIYHIEPIVLSKKQTKLNKQDLYIVRIENAKKIMDDYRIYESRVVPLDLITSIDKECCRKAYIKGAFLASGSINNPETFSYHLEIQTFNYNNAKSLLDLMNEYELKAKVTENKRGFIIYIKEAEKISDFLKLMGSFDYLYEFEDFRIQRDLSNSINRVMNCEIANQKKALVASKKILEDIELVERYYGERISPTLLEAIILRRKFPEHTLIELSEESLTTLNKPLTKSALNHRFRAIREIAQGLRRNNDRK